MDLVSQWKTRLADHFLSTYGRINLASPRRPRDTNMRHRTPEAGFKRESSGTIKGRNTVISKEILMVNQSTTVLKYWNFMCVGKVSDNVSSENRNSRTTAYTHLPTQGSMLPTATSRAASLAWEDVSYEALSLYIEFTFLNRLEVPSENSRSIFISWCLPGRLLNRYNCVSW